MLSTRKYTRCANIFSPTSSLSAHANVITSGGFRLNRTSAVSIPISKRGPNEDGKSSVYRKHATVASDLNGSKSGHYFCTFRSMYFVRICVYSFSNRNSCVYLNYKKKKILKKKNGAVRFLTRRFC